MAYTYYKEVILEEHLLFAEEIAESLSQIGYNISVNKIHKTMRDSDQEPLYYKTRAGLKKVYSLPIVIKALQERGELT